MKQTTESVTVDPEPAYAYDVHTWTCEVPGCDFESQDEETAQHHHGKEHALKDSRQCAGRTFYRFDSDDDVRAYAAAGRANDFHIDAVGDPECAGPGWYFFDREKMGCRCGGCDNHRSWLRPATVALTWAKDSINKYEQQVEDLTKLINGQ